MAMVKPQAGREVEHGATGLRGDRPWLEAYRPLARANLGVEAGEIGEHVDVVPAHLIQPRRRHHRAHALRIDEHNSRMAHADVFVGRLDQLPAGRVTRADDVARFEFLTRAHVQQV